MDEQRLGEYDKAPPPEPKKPKPQGEKGYPPYPFQFVSRQEWGALEPTAKAPLLYHPVEYFTYKFTKTDACNNRKDCIRLVQELQKTHMLVKGLHDIAYNFVIGGDLTVYEGRGWYHKAVKLDDKQKEYDGRTIDIGYMGYPRAGIRENFYCIEILELREKLITWGEENGFFEEYALWDRIDLFDD